MFGKNNMETVLSQKTLVPIGFVIILAGGMFWLTTIYNTVNDHTVKMEKLELSINNVQKDYNEIRDRTVRIETKIDILIDKYNQQ